MCNHQIRYGNPYRLSLLVVFLLFCHPAYPQSQKNNNTVYRISTGPLFESTNNGSFFSGIPYRDPSRLVTAKYISTDKDLVFYDSLKARAAKKPMTKKLYDIIIVTHDTLNSKQITGSSDAIYYRYSGNKIRNIEVERLNVFGMNINDPVLSNPKKIENFLNSTHVNTNEKIIRKNLLFSVGDTISPLTLSDNERILRQLPFIDDARIIVVPVSENESDILVLTKDVYSLGGSYLYKGLKEGSASIFEKNIFGIGHELGVEMQYDSKKPESPGFGFHYLVNNVAKSFLDLNVYYLNALGDKTYGFSLGRNLISSTSKYAGGLSVRQMYTLIALKPLSLREPLNYNLQDYWFARSFLINKESVSRIILGARYTNNNVFDRPIILPNSYYSLQKYRIYLGSAAFSIQKYYKTSLIYGYGRTEDIPYGGLFKVTVGKENNEFKQRTYVGTEISFGESSKKLGYFYTSAGIATYFNMKQTEQGILSLKMKYFSNLVYLRKSRIRNFVNIDYTRGFDRNTDEHLNFYTDNGFSGFRNDSAKGAQRFTISLETVLFSPVTRYGFRFAYFGFTDFSVLSGTNQVLSNGIGLAGIGLGLRVRNDNLLFNTFQFRFGFFPNPPVYSKINYLVVSGEQLLKPNNFDSGPPTIIPFR